MCVIYWSPRDTLCACKMLNTHVKSILWASTWSKAACRSIYCVWWLLAGYWHHIFLLLIFVHVNLASEYSAVKIVTSNELKKLIFYNLKKLEVTFMCFYIQSSCLEVMYLRTNRFYKVIKNTASPQTEPRWETVERNYCLLTGRRKRKLLLVVLASTKLWFIWRRRNQTQGLRWKYF